MGKNLWWNIGKSALTIAGGIVGSVVPVIGTAAGAALGNLAGKGVQYGFDNDYRKKYTGGKWATQGLMDVADIGLSAVAGAGVGKALGVGMNAAGSATASAAGTAMNTAGKEVVAQGVKAGATGVTAAVGKEVTKTAIPSLASKVFNVGMAGLGEIGKVSSNTVNADQAKLAEEQNLLNKKLQESEKDLANKRDIAPAAKVSSPMFTDPSMFGMSDNAKKKTAVSNWYNF